MTEVEERDAARALAAQARNVAAEDRVRAARATGLRNLPLHDTAQNRVWLEIVQIALDLRSARPASSSPPAAARSSASLTTGHGPMASPAPSYSSTNCSPTSSSAAVLTGAGTGLITPLGFAVLAASTPAERLGQTMGAAELGRELGDAGGPLLVAAVASLATLTYDYGALAALIGLGTVVALVRRRRVSAVSEPET
ncbi:hypothetical protein ABZ642_45515 [Streptomyces sp. NPDC007157]|uniref:hypothetical protein n=1 Tax=Streptomyces sp. NPDC007157 TaxID=3154681 RepID=UPI00340F593B